VSVPPAVPIPRTLVFEVTDRCDHACRHCYARWRRGQQARDAHDLRPLAGHVLDQLDVSDITLTGGEPTLHPGLADLVAYLDGRHRRVNLVTHGHHLDEPTVIDLIDRGVALFELPLLSHRREVHDELSGAPGAFDAVLAALAHIRYHRGGAAVVFVATRRNIADLAQALKLAFAFGARGLLLNRFNPGTRDPAEIEALLPSVEELTAALDVADAVAGEMGLRVSCSIPIQPCLVDTARYTHLGFGYCAVGTPAAYYTVGPTGDVRPCNHSSTVLGNAWREPMASILSSERLEPFMAPLPQVCEPCSRRVECRGGCRAAAEVCGTGIGSPEPFLAANEAAARSGPRNKHLA
jgi:radical SAM protein with 4Fe4S-binding SPASM domain